MVGLQDGKKVSLGLLRIMAAGTSIKAEGNLGNLKPPFLDGYVWDWLGGSDVFKVT